MLTPFEIFLDVSGIVLLVIQLYLYGWDIDAMMFKKEDENEHL